MLLWVICSFNTVPKYFLVSIKTTQYFCIIMADVTCLSSYLWQVGHEVKQVCVVCFLRRVCAHHYWWPCCTDLLLAVCGGEHTDFLYHCLVWLLCGWQEVAATSGKTCLKITNGSFPSLGDIYVSSYRSRAPCTMKDLPGTKIIQSLLYRGKSKSAASSQSRDCYELLGLKSVLFFVLLWLAIDAPFLSFFKYGLVSFILGF